MTGATTAHTGERLAGRYRLEEPIGYGGMGHVYRAVDELLDRPVAIKLLDDERGLNEARATARLAHPGVVQVYDMGEQDGEGYIVLELVDGTSLRDLLRQRRTLPSAEATQLAAKVADTLDVIHRQGLVHCDVKPRNIIVTETGQPKLVDFGIARAAKAGERAPADEVMGSAAYVAPEQARGLPVDGRTDVYALGAVLYEMLIGRPPFNGSSPTAVVTQRFVADPKPPRVLDSSIAPELEAVVLRALARDPAKRYASAAAMRDALRGLEGTLRRRRRLLALLGVSMAALALLSWRDGSTTPSTPVVQAEPAAEPTEAPAPSVEAPAPTVEAPAPAPARSQPVKAPAPPPGKKKTGRGEGGD